MTAAPSADLVEAVLRRGASQPARVAIRDAHGGSVTFGEVAARARGVAAHLSARGIQPGDGVLLAVRPSPRAVMAALGVVLAGGVVVVADPGAGEALVDVRRRAVPVRAAVADTVVHAATRPPLSTLLARLPATAGMQLPDLSQPGLVHVVTGPRLPGVPRSATRWERLPEVESSTATGDPERDALVVFTSGSTAAPRAVVHTVRSLSAGVDAAVEALGLDGGVVMHTDQLMIGLPTLVAGGVWSLPRVAAPARAWVRQAAREQATHVYAVPRTILAAAAVGLPSTVRHVAMGGAPVLPETVRRLRELVPTVELRAVYGLTEALPVAVATAAEILASPAGRTRLGRPVRATTLRIAPAEDVTEVGVGEIVVRGPQVRHRLVGGEPSAEVRTGDLGELEPDGSLLLAGRAKNMIIRGQANIYPDLVEPLLLPVLGEIAEDCALVGLMDPVSGDERVVLAVVPGHRRPGAEAVSRSVHRAWASVADDDWRPDDVVLVDAVPRRGRSQAVDLLALRSVVGSRLGTAP